MDPVCEQISKFILTEIVEDSSITSLAEDTPLLDTGIIDSLGILKILAFLDEALGVDLSSDEIKRENFTSLAVIRDVVARQKS